jgi:methionyl-tRNA synthetase
MLERYDPDAIRYYVTAVMPETRDADFSWDDFLSRTNNELVATWGNLANRMLGFAYKRYNGQVPEPGTLRPADKLLLAQAEAAFETVGERLSACQFRAALGEAMGLAREANKYLDEQAPWFEIKRDKDQAAKTVYTILRTIDNLKLLLAPFLPFSSERLHQMLGYDGKLFGELEIKCYQESSRDHYALTYDPSSGSGRWEASKIPAGQQLRKPAPLFAKLDPDIVEEERDRLGSN